MAHNFIAKRLGLRNELGNELATGTQAVVV
jgi:hypothetical protein